LKLFFTLDSKLNTVEALVEVVWTDIQTNKDRKDSRCGVNFVDVSPGDMAKLNKFMKGFSK